MGTETGVSQGKNSNQNQQDIQDIFRENFDKYFQEVEKPMPQYLESMTKLQDEFLNAWKNTVDTSLNLQKEYAEKMDINTNVPQDAANMIYRVADEYIKSKNIQNQVILSTLNSASSNVQNSNNTFQPFIELNKKVLSFWSDFYLKNKQ